MNTKLAQSRRTFIKGIGTVALGAAALGVAQTAHAATPENDIATDIDSIEWDEEYDVLVVGAGAAGMAASLTVAIEGNGAKTLLLEKGSSIYGGGNSVFSSGQATFVAAEDVEGYFEYLKEMRGDFTATPDDILHTFAEGLVENGTWLTETLGANPDDLSISDSGSSEWPELEHSGLRKVVQFNTENTDAPTHAMFFLGGLIAEKYSDLITEKTDARLVALIQDPLSKVVVGGVYEYEGAQVYVKATKGVIMCTGGFENDDVMKQDYLSIPISHPAAGVCNTGDGHRICMKLGADLWHMNNFAGVWTNAIKLDGSEMLNYRGLRKAQGITVGVNGRRFYSDWEGSTMFPRDIEHGADMSLVYGCRHGKQNFGGEYTHLPLPTTTWFVFDSVGLDQGAYLGTNSGSVATQNQTMTGNTADPVADGYGLVADTIEDLAAQMGVPADELVNTVDTWNNSCANGNDEYFHRHESTLQPVSTAPFYAVKCVPEILNTDGGPRRGVNAEILDIDGEPIPHLYSAGEFGSVWTNKYEGCGNIAECYVFGRIAARSALKNE